MMDTQDSKFIAIWSAIMDWNTHYGNVKITEVKNIYIVELITGGWSDNESAAINIYGLHSIHDTGGYYMLELYKYAMSPEQLRMLSTCGIDIIKKKKFIYNVVRE